MAQMTKRRTRSSIFLVCGAVAVTSLGCRRPPSLESTIERFLTYPGTGNDGDMTQAICGWPVYLKMASTRLTIGRRTGATEAAGIADFAIDTFATTADGTKIVCTGVGSFAYQQRSGSASHGPRGRDHFQISDIRRTNPWPDSVGRAAGAPTTATGVLDTWLPVTLLNGDVLPDKHPAVAMQFQITTPGRYELRTRPAPGVARTSLNRSAAYQNDRMLNVDSAGKSNSWQLTAGVVAIIIDGVTPAQLEIRLSAY